MNGLLKICAFSLLASLCALLVRAQHKEASRLVALCGGMMLLAGVITQVQPVVEALQAFSREAGLEDDTLALLLRLIAMAYLTEFAVQACRDAGEEGLSMKAALAGKLMLAAQTVPLVTRIGRIAMEFLP